MTGRPPPRKPPPRRPTPTSLETAGLHYLARYAASAEQVRRVLARRVDRAARAHPDLDREAAAGWIAALVDRWRAAGLLDDATFAEARVRSLRRRGASGRRIRDALAAKGVDRDTIDAAVAGEEGAADASGEIEAARRLAKRRRLGPFRPAGDRAENRMRDLAALARAGFARDVAVRVVDGGAEDG
jgi:regulatory protein